MNVILWLVLFGLASVPVSILLADRILGVPAAWLFRWSLLPWAAASIIAIAYSLASGDEVVSLVAAGVAAGLLGTIGLDIVRLIGVRRGAFPLDMPIMFGLIALGLAPKLQQNLMGRLVEHLATLGEGERRAMLSVRLRAVARQPARWRLELVAAMRAGVERLSAEQRQAVVQSQVNVMASDLEAGERRSIMQAMDGSVPIDAGPVPYGQPIGMPRVPMALFQRLAERAIPDTIAQSGSDRGTVTVVGYTWHFVIGIAFGVMYTLLVGAGSWGWALAWGLFIWAAMMIAMPFMMRMIRFPNWFPVVPLIAHVAMALAFGAVALATLGPAATEASLLGSLGWI